MAGSDSNMCAYKLDPETRKRIHAERPPIQYPGGVVPLETLRACGITGVHINDVLNSLKFQTKSETQGAKNADR